MDLLGQDDGQSHKLTLLTDALGSVRGQMRGTSLQASTSYGPYGAIHQQTGTSQTSYGYTGEQFHAGTGLLYLRARYYSPSLHAFTSRDPWAGDGIRPATMNGYGYVEGNPIRFVDPTGQFSQEALVEYVLREEPQCLGFDRWCAQQIVYGWMRDPEWWGMLTIANVGDIVFGGYQSQDSFYGNGKYNDLFYYTFESLNDNVVENPIYGAVICRPPLTGPPLYNHGAFSKLGNIVSLNELFLGFNKPYEPKSHYSAIWGGLFKRQGRHVIDIYHRPSVSNSHQVTSNPTDEFKENAVYSFGTAVGTTALCSVICGPGGIACGVIASTTTGIAPSFFSNPYQENDWIVTSAGHEFIYRAELYDPLGSFSGAKRHVIYRDNTVMGFHLITPLR